jgi:hypothetical protein
VSNVVIPESTQQVISDSTFRLAGTYRYASVRSVARPEDHLMVTRDETEITVVTREEHLAGLDVIAVNPDRWQLLAIDCANPFYCVGFIAKISSAFTGAGLDILFISTFSRDLLFVKEEDGPRGAGLLRAMGFQELQR